MAATGIARKFRGRHFHERVGLSSLPFPSFLRESRLHAVPPAAPGHALQRGQAPAFHVTPGAFRKALPA